jgi:hypothetical protein
MKPELLRIKIAEACGWTITRDVSAIPSLWVITNGTHTKRVASHKTKEDAYLIAIPDYLNDLNAMHEAEKILDRSQQNAYINILDGMPDDACPVHHDFQWCCATAAQRAEAFLRTLGLWEEEP